MSELDLFLAAREILLKYRNDYQAAYANFQWPLLNTFNWAWDWFDSYAQHNQQTALWLVPHQGPETTLSYASLAARSNQVCAFLREQHIGRGDRIMVLLPNISALWELTLAALKLGAVIVPTSMQASLLDLKDRISRGRVKLVITDDSAVERIQQIEGSFLRCLVGKRLEGWLCYEDALSTSVPKNLRALTKTHMQDPFLLYFTSGTTALPKLVLHTQYSYPVGHLSTMYWLGLRPFDLHQNISSPGWAKHAWSSFFAPFNAGASVLVAESPRFNAQATIALLNAKGVSSLCAPPTVWRMLVLEKMGARPQALSECVSAGEPLNAEIIAQVEANWGITIRDGYGQTETTAQIANSPGQIVKPGAMGRPLPGYRIALLNSDGLESDEGEVAIRLRPTKAMGLMAGYENDPERNAKVLSEDYYLTGDEAWRDAEGSYHFVGRADDVFKSSDYRISPFELESVLIEHELVAEAAVVESQDPLRLFVPKAFISLVPPATPSAALAKRILTDTNAKLAPYKRLCRLEFAALPKTISGKVRRVALRTLERERHAQHLRGSDEYWLEEL